ncbi:MAG TPA: dCTP deaminase [Thermoanaerobaculia bacterium]|jgi:dCTP deaminase
MAIDTHTVETILRRANTIQDELAQFALEEYPAETTQLRDLLVLITGYIGDVLHDIHRAPTYTDETSLQVQQLARSVHEVYAMVRYLRASASLSTPPALHALVTYLAAGRFTEPHLTIVRPQWEYNCKFVNLSYELTKITINRLTALLSGKEHLLGEPDLVLPDGKEQGDDPAGSSQKTLSLMWQRAERRKKQSGEKRANLKDAAIPKHIGVLSLAGVDKGDVFLYPMMAHEVAHFITYARPKPLHLTVTAKIGYTRASLRKQMAADHRKHSNAELPTLAAIVTKKIEICVRELLADLVAVRLLGVSYFFGLASFLRGLFQWTDPLIAADSSYPSMRLRLKMCLEELCTFPDVARMRRSKGGKRRGGTEPNAVHELSRILRGWNDQHLSTPLVEETIAAGHDEVDDMYLHALCTNAIIRGREAIIDAAREVVPDATASISSKLSDRVRHLVNKLPPVLPDDTTAALPEIFAAGWIHRYITPPVTSAEYERRNRLLTKAIELVADAAPGLDASNSDVTHSSGPTAPPVVLSGDVIRARTRRKITDAGRFAVIPFNAKSVSAASLDLHLGNWFKLSRRPKMSTIDISRAKEFLKTGVLHEEFFVKRNQPFILHAGDFALGITEEFVGMPNDVMGFVEGKSSIGRTGLIVATATQVAPGFHGCIVLELANTGTIPLEIRPGMSIAQLVMISTGSAVSSELLYSGDFDCQIRP